MIGFFSSANGQHIERAAVAHYGQGRTVRSSWYGGGERLARHTASGAVFRPGGLTVAHRSLPFGTRVRLHHNGRSVIAVVNDRGPAKWTGRELDVSRGTASALGFLSQGTANLRMEVMR